MKLFVYLLSALFIFAIAGLFVIKMPDGKSLLSVEKVKSTAQSWWLSTSSEFSSIEGKVVRGYNEASKVISDNVGDNDAIEYYRWQDEQGTWHYSDKKVEHPSIEKVAYEPNRVNVLPAVKVEPSQAEMQADTAQSSSKKTHANNTKDEENEVNKVLTLINDAKNVQTILDDRKKQLDQAIAN